MRTHQLNLVEDSFSSDFLADEVGGFFYCHGSIYLSPFEIMKLTEVESDIDYSIYCDFKSMYGIDFAFLCNHQPEFVNMAEDSPVAVKWKPTTF